METAQKVRVLGPDGVFVYAVRGPVALQMLAAGIAIYVGKPGRKLYDIHLPVPTPADHAAASALRLFNQANTARKIPGVNKHQQAAGSTKWVVRMDNAATGWAGGEDRVWFPNNVQARRLGTGKAERPAAQN